MIALIAAVSRNGVIGKDGKIPWRLPEDLKRFKALTLGHVLVMGRKTYESIGKPLPGRETIVLTSGRLWFESKEVAPKNLVSATSLDAALASTGEDIFICGGVEVYREALERDVVDKVYLTQIDADFEGDTLFPFVHELFSEPRWQLMKETEWSTPGTFPHRYWFREYDRKR